MVGFVNLTYDTATELPYGEVYRSKHSTQWHHQIADANTVLLTQVGSGLHGVSFGDDDDRDEMGVCIEPPTVALGFDQFDLYEYRSKPMSVRSGAGDLDLNIYGLRKYVKLVAAGNPTVLMPLFAPESEIVRCEWPGLALRAARDMFVTRDAGNRFLRYHQRQMERFEGSLSQRTNRPELIERYGYDTKFAYHALRLCEQGYELMTEGEITLPMKAYNREWLLAVRRGEFSRDQIQAQLTMGQDRLSRAIERSELPDHADWGRVSRWCAGVYRKWWGRKGL